ncbi:hypothetical protein B7463_g800, partial [Scytalidium lignicola]
MGSIMRKVYRLGVDVGGTNTDAALICITESPGEACLTTQVVATKKTPTTADVTLGICEAIRVVLKETGVPRSDILSVNIGTTHFINAVIQADESKLNRVAVLRLCGPFCREVPPFAGFPQRLRNVVEGYVGYLDGGLEIDGRVIAEINEQEVVKHAAAIREGCITAIVVIGVFSALDTATVTQEEQVKRILLEQIPDADIVCSRDIGRVGFIERENETILNASILGVGRHTISGFEAATRDLDLHCPLYLTQNDGTVIDAVAARKNGDIDPKTSQVVMVDIGGTTSDFAALSPSGFPRQSNATVSIAGVRTAFSMPEVLSIGLGGGSLVHEDGTVGPTSVGYALTTESQCFGGQTLTATDIVVASGADESINPGWEHGISQGIIERARLDIKRQLQRGVELMRTSDTDNVILLVVGGGSVLQMDDIHGIKKCIRPPFHDCANAVGAAIAKISGDVDIIIIPGAKTHEEIEADLKSQAIVSAIENGAQHASVEVVELDVIPIQYVTNNAVRGVAKAVGELGRDSSFTVHTGSVHFEIPQAAPKPIKKQIHTSSKAPLTIIEQELEIYTPEVSKATGEWFVSEIDLAFIAEGVGIFGTGGGGSTYATLMNSIDVLGTITKGRMRIIEAEAAFNGSHIALVAGVGSPSVSNERLAGSTEFPAALTSLAKYHGIEKYAGLMHPEIGGGNGMCGFGTAAAMDIPVIDADTMGRAFPRVDMSLPYLYGACAPYPAVVADARSNSQIIAFADSARRMENLMRTTCVELGHGAAVAMSIPGTAVRDNCCHNTLSMSWYVGRSIYLARRQKRDVVAAVIQTWPGSKLLYTGKVTSFSKTVSGGWTTGMCVIYPDTETHERGTARDDSRPMVLQYQNEFLYAALRNSDLSLEPVCTTPDMVTVLDQDGSAIATNELRYGLRVSVIAMPAHPLWFAPKAMKESSPQAFGLDMPYTSYGGMWEEPPSVIREFGK